MNEINQTNTINGVYVCGTVEKVVTNQTQTGSNINESSNLNADYTIDLSTQNKNDLESNTDSTDSGSLTGKDTRDASDSESEDVKNSNENTRNLAQVTTNISIAINDKLVRNGFNIELNLNNMHTIVINQAVSLYPNDPATKKQQAEAFFRYLSYFMLCGFLLVAMVTSYFGLPRLISQKNEDEEDENQNETERPLNSHKNTSINCENQWF